MASIGQFVGVTLPDLVNRVFLGDIRSAVNQGISFLICTAGFAFVGGVVAYFFQSRTQNRWSLFLIGAVFTSVGFQALPGAKKLLKMADIPIGRRSKGTSSPGPWPPAHPGLSFSKGGRWQRRSSCVWRPRKDRDLWRGRASMVDKPAGDVRLPACARGDGLHGFIELTLFI